MKFGLLVVVAIVASAFLAHFLLQDPGYVVISFRDYLVEMSVPVLLAAIALLLIGTWLLVGLFRAPRKLGESYARYRDGRAGERLTRGMIEIAEGNFSRGEKLLARTAGKSDTPLLNYLQAARAAHLRGDHDRRDSWLRKAYEKMPEASSAVLLTQAELQLDQKQYEQALATLRTLEEKAPNHSHALNLLGRLYYRLEDWEQLEALLPRLRKHGRVDAAQLHLWTTRLHRQKLAAAGDKAAADAAWREVPRQLKNETELLEAYYAALLRTGEHEQAEREIAARLRKDWRGPLVRLYGLLESGDPARQLKRAEAWLRKHPDDVDLLLAAARLCLRNELWGKARSYLETVLTLQPTPEAYHEYGRLLNRLGEGEAAAEAFRSGLNMVVPGGRPAIPQLPGKAGLR